MIVRTAFIASAREPALNAFTARSRSLDAEINVLGSSAAV